MIGDGVGDGSGEGSGDVVVLGDSGVPGVLDAKHIIMERSYSRSLDVIGAHAWSAIQQFQCLLRLLLPLLALKNGQARAHCLQLFPKLSCFFGVYRARTLLRAQLDEKLDVLA